MKIMFRRIYWYFLFKFMTTSEILDAWIKSQGDITLTPAQREYNPLSGYFFSEIVRRAQRRYNEKKA